MIFAELRRSPRFSIINGHFQFIHGAIPAEGDAANDCGQLRDKLAFAVRRDGKGADRPTLDRYSPYFSSLRILWARVATGRVGHAIGGLHPEIFVGLAQRTDQLRLLTQYVAK